MNKIKKYIVAHKVITGIAVVVIAGLGYYVYAKLHTTTAATQYVFGKVQRGDLAVTVSGTGQVATLNSVSIKPQTTGQTQTLGQITQVNVINGQTVKAGDVIAILDGKTALQAVNQAESSVASAQATYDKLVNGPTASDLQSYNSSLQSSTQGIQTKLQTDYLSVSNAVFLNTDPFFTDPTVVPTLAIGNVYYTDQSLQTKVQNERIQIETDLQSLQNDVTESLTSTDPTAITNDAITRFTNIRNYFNDMTNLLTLDGVSISSAGQTTLDSDEVTASGARSSANSAVDDMINALQTYQNATTSLMFKVAPPNPDDVIVAKAQLDNANANLATAEQTYASRIITAPFDGQIGGLTAQIGQQVSSSDVLGTIITAQKVVNVSLNEVDAAKVTAGNSVSLTFDALPNLTLQGTVSYLDPLGTVSQGVVNYSVQIMINDQNGQLKTGMTATAIITTQTDANVLTVPTSAITTTGNRSFVLVPNTPPTGITPSSTNPAYSGNFSGFASSTAYMASSTATSTASSTRFRGTGTRTFGGTTGTGTNTAVQAVTATVHPVPVTIGITNGVNTEITSGLNEGDTIVVRTVTGTTGTTAAASTARTGSIFGVGGTTGGGGVRTGGGGGGGRVGG